MDNKSQKLWKAVKEYLDFLHSKIPHGMLVSHGYFIDDRKQFEK